MKIAIVAANNIRLSPYIFFYTNILDENHINYDIIYPQRNGYQDIVPAHVYEVPWNCDKSSFMNYLSYSKEVEKIVSHENYNFLIVLTTINAVFLSNWLRKKYKGKYIVDVRDYTYENNKLYYFAEKIAMNNSCVNVISSRAFQNFLPKGKYITCHNISVDRSVRAEKFCKKSRDEKITIGYVGGLGYVEQCKSLMRLVNKDDRFVFHFYGTSAQEATLRKYAEEIKCNRIVFYGGYNPSDKPNIISKVDILFNSYGNDSDLLKFALSNKLYDALYYHKLLLTSPNTAMDNVAHPISFAIDYGCTESLNDLYNWYYSLDYDNVWRFMEEKFNEFDKENIDTINYIVTVLINEKEKNNETNI